MNFTVTDYIRTKDPYIVEQRVHEDLRTFMVAGEFFQCDVATALVKIQDKVIE